LDASTLRLDELNAFAEDPDLWNDPEAAQKVMRERNHLEQSISQYHGLEQELDDAVTLAELGEVEGDEASVDEAAKLLEALCGRAAKLQLASLLSGEADANDCYLEIHAGAGGTEAQDWAQMLVRMYVRWSEAHGYKTEWLEESPGEEAGLKSATVLVKGTNAYGWLKTESGVHRLVRISPFDSQSRRHTSFASDSAVRMTHLPTGIVVQCQNDRSQHKNRAQAMAMLKARLYEHELQKREEAVQAEQDAKSDIGWGHQIRSYVLQPYQMVKDLRTNVEKGNAQGVLDGDIDAFLEAALAAKVNGDEATAES
jgi:peptide chain release factor 2